MINSLHAGSFFMHFCRMLIFLNKRALVPWVAHLRLTDQSSGTICEILVECIMRNNSVFFFF